MPMMQPTAQKIGSTPPKRKPVARRKKQPVAATWDEAEYVGLARSYVDQAAASQSRDPILRSIYQQMLHDAMRQRSQARSEAQRAFDVYLGPTPPVEPPQPEPNPTPMPIVRLGHRKLC